MSKIIRPLKKKRERINQLEQYGVTITHSVEAKGKGRKRQQKCP